MSEAGDAEEGERDQARPRARRARPEGRPGRARRAVPDPLRPDLQLPARQRRQPARRRGPDDADVPEDARGDRQVPLAVGAVLGVALPDRPQPRDGPLPRQQALAARGGRAGARSRRVHLRRARALESIGRKSMLELIEDLSLEQQQVLTLKFVFNFANAEAATILGKTEGAIKSLQHRALVSLQKQLETARSRQRRLATCTVALEVGIVGPAGSGKTSLFTALTKTGGGEYGKTNVGMAPIADARLDALAAGRAARGRSRRRRSASRTSPAPARRSSGTSARSTRCSSSSRGFGAGRRPGRRSRDVQARAARRRPRPRRAAARARREAGEVGRREAAGRGRGAEEGARARRCGRRADRTTPASCPPSSSR